jgi:hypothetical protein
LFHCETLDGVILVEIRVQRYCIYSPLFDKAEQGKFSARICSLSTNCTTITLTFVTFAKSFF